MKICSLRVIRLAVSISLVAPAVAAWSQTSAVAADRTVPSVIEGSALLRRAGYSPDDRLLILHADDLGMSHSVDLASFQALENGWVSSASVMVPCPWFDEVREFARLHPAVDIGLHLTLTSEWSVYRWRGLTTKTGSSLLDASGYLPASSAPVGERARGVEAQNEILEQVRFARNAGLHFTHLDNHMGALSQSRSLFEAYAYVGQQAGVPIYISEGERKAYASVLLGMHPLVVPTTIGPAPGTDVLEGWRRTLETLKPGVYVSIVHLGMDDTELRAIEGERAGGAAERQREFDLVANPVFREMLRKYGVKLVRWQDLTANKEKPAEPVDVRTKPQR